MLDLINIFRCQKLVQSPVSQLIRYFHKESIPVAWKKPGIGWTKLNFDGSCKVKSGKASIGGVIRNHNAEFLLGYAESIGRANSTIAELTALRRGLELVLENGWNDIWLEGDAKTLVEIIVQRRQVRCMEVQRHISHINSILPGFNNCIVSHIYREGNRAADKFAQMGHHLDKPRIWRDVPPDEVLAIVHEDAQGKVDVYMCNKFIDTQILDVEMELFVEHVNDQLSWQQQSLQSSNCNRLHLGCLISFPDYDYCDDESDKYSGKVGPLNNLRGGTGKVGFIR